MTIFEVFMAFVLAFAAIKFLGIDKGWFMNNFEKIKSMDIDEMAEFIDGNCQLCKFFEDEDCWEQDCKIGHKQWLESEVREWVIL